ncbi:MAG: hypothetical protein GXO76_14065 [Calditrichaeota bacterium]|nr:hypothetical protein [Calditrichota bacterium]
MFEFIGFLLITAVGYVTFLGRPAYDGNLITFAVGFLLLSGYLLGKLLLRIKFPKLTGYILAGIVFGPYIFSFLTNQTVEKLRLIDDLALSIIALSAGGELRLSQLKEDYRSLLYITIIQTAGMFVIITTLIYLFAPAFNFLRDFSRLQIFSVSMIFGIVLVTKSPSTTIAMISELKAKGKFTEIVLGITILKDVVVILLFALVFSLARKLLQADNPAENHLMTALMIELFGSLLVGGAIGWVLIEYLKHGIPYVSLFILGIIFFVSKFAPLIHLNILLIFIVAGFLIENFTPLGDRLLRIIDQSSLIIYVLFFAVAGASLNLVALRETWMLALLIVLIRILAVWSSTLFGSMAARAIPAIRNYSWMGFVSQAGVGLGLAILVERTFPGWGADFKTLILAVIAINQIIGPILFKYALVKSGDARVLQ